jgi:hypothetical protein
MKASAQSALAYPDCKNFGFCSVTATGVAWSFFPVGINHTVTSIDLTGHPISMLYGDELYPYKALEAMYAVFVWLLSVGLRVF